MEHTRVGNEKAIYFLSSLQHILLTTVQSIYLIKNGKIQIFQQTTVSCITYEWANFVQESVDQVDLEMQSRVEMLDSLCRLPKKLRVALVREAIASSVSFTSIGLRPGIGWIFLALMLTSGSNQGRRLHCVDNDSALVRAAVRTSTLAKMDNKISSVSMLSLSSSFGCCEIMNLFS